jgi:plastocyanin
VTLLSLPSLAAAQQFSGVTNFPGTARWTEGVECADVDKDGDLDVFFAEGEGFASAGTQRQNILIINKLIEIGEWNFADESVARLGTNLSNAKGVCTGDVTGDGWVDALFANAFFTDPPFLYINQGVSNPGFFNQEGAARGLPTSYSSGSAQFGDLDDDGDLDLIINDAYLSAGAGKPHLFFNDGTGNFTENAAALGAPNKAEQMDVQLVDIDNDWDLDFFGDTRAINGGGNHYLMLNNGSGTFSDSSSLISAGNGSTYESEVGDLDNDDDLDLFFVSLNNFQEGAVRNNIVPSLSLGFTTQSAFGPSVDDNEIALFDYDNDSDYDIVVGSLGAHEYVYRNDGSLAFVDTSAASITFNSNSTLDCTVADLNNDGKYDIITAQGESNSAQWANKFYRNTGTADALPPLVTGHINPATAPALGPVLAHAKVRDQVLDDGVNYVNASATYKINTAAAAASISITGGGFVPPTISVPAGTTITWTNNSGGTQSVKSTTAPYTYDSGNVANAATHSQTFVNPGVYDYTSVPGGINGQVTVTGSATTVDGKYSGGQLYRFQMDDNVAGAGIELCYELRFTDWAGNITVTDARLVTLIGNALGTPYCFGDGSIATACPCFLPNTVPNPPAAPAHGCANSFSADGALLSATGTTVPDTVTFDVLVSPNYVSFGLMLKGNGSLPGGTANGDGIRCVDGALIRFGAHFAATAGAPIGHWTYPNTVQTTPVSVQTLQAPGQTAYYQLFYRNTAANFCNSGTTNWSNGFEIAWP